MIRILLRWLMPPTAIRLLPQDQTLLRTKCLVFPFYSRKKTCEIERSFVYLNQLRHAAALVWVRFDGLARPAIQSPYR